MVWHHTVPTSKKDEDRHKSSFGAKLQILITNHICIDFLVLFITQVMLFSFIQCYCMLTSALSTNPKHSIKAMRCCGGGWCLLRTSDVKCKILRTQPVGDKQNRDAAIFDDLNANQNQFPLSSNLINSFLPNLIIHSFVQTNLIISFLPNLIIHSFVQTRNRINQKLLSNDSITTL